MPDEATPLPMPDIKVEFGSVPIGVVDDPDDEDEDEDDDEGEDDSMTAVYLSAPLAFLVFVTRIRFHVVFGDASCFSSSAGASLFPFAPFLAAAGAVAGTAAGAAASGADSTADADASTADADADADASGADSTAAAASAFLTA